MYDSTILFCDRDFKNKCKSNRYIHTRVILANEVSLFTKGTEHAQRLSIQLVPHSDNSISGTWIEGLGNPGYTSISASKLSNTARY